MAGGLSPVRLSLVEARGFGEDSSSCCLNCLSGTSEVSSCSSSCNVFGRSGTFGLHISLINCHASIHQFHVRRLRVFCSASWHPDDAECSRILTLSVNFIHLYLDRLGDGDEDVG